MLKEMFDNSDTSMVIVLSYNHITGEAKVDSTYTGTEAFQKAIDNRELAESLNPEVSYTIIANDTAACEQSDRIIDDLNLDIEEDENGYAN